MRRSRPSRIDRHRMPVFRPAAFLLVPAAGLGLVLILYILWSVRQNAKADADPSASPNKPGGPNAPSEWFYAQRVYPHAEIKPEDLARARNEGALLRQAASDAAVPWDPVGPINIGGRIADLAVHPFDPQTVYVGSAEGGILKTTDGGFFWTPTFDNLETLSIGDVTVDPTNGDIVYAGTGEPNNGGGSVTYGGLGVYKTTNGGATWNNMGLSDTRYIGRIVIDPTNTQRLFVAAMGALFSTNPERGVYRSTDAGQSWQHVLSVTDSTGAIDLVIDRLQPNRIYAATWERIRHPHTRRYGGPTSAVYRSTDGGNNWSILGGGLPSPAAVNGRIGLAIANSNPSVLYAIYADEVGNFAGVYKTTNGGDSWVRTNDGALSGSYATYGWWFGNIRVDPVNADRVFVVGFNTYRSTNGGASWAQIGANMHVDHHALEWVANGTGQTMYDGNDGGLYISSNGGTNWTEITNLPITQFYTVAVDHQIPEATLRRHPGQRDQSARSPAGSTTGPRSTAVTVSTSTSTRATTTSSTPSPSMADSADPRTAARPSPARPPASRVAIGSIGRRRWCSIRPTRRPSTSAATGSIAAPTAPCPGLRSRTISRTAIRARAASSSARSPPLPPPRPIHR